MYFKTITKLLSLAVCLTAFSVSAVAADKLFDKRFQRWKKQAVDGDKRAQYKIGLAFLRGSEVKVNIPRAIKWFERSANQGYIKAAHKLGLIYYSNKDGQRNYRKGFRWFLKAANERYAPAQYYIGRMYLEGRGVRRDLDRAMLWAKRAESQQLIKAKNLIADIETAQKKSTGSSSRPVARTKPKPTRTVRRTASRPTPKSSSRRTSPVAATRFNTLRIVSSGGWQLNGKPAEHMPSTLNNCKTRGDTYKCQTGRIRKNTRDWQAHYQVETTLHEFASNGTFSVRFRRNYLFVLPEDPDNPDPPKGMPNLGYEKNIRSLKCRVLTKTKMHCFTDDFKIERYTKE